MCLIILSLLHSLLESVHPAALLAVLLAAEVQFAVLSEKTNNKAKQPPKQHITSQHFTTLHFSMASPAQIIDENHTFTPPVFTTGNNVNNYNVVAVFGSQSSGKSTLLNNLFNTNFDTMDAANKRQQTTKGVWIAQSPFITCSEHDNVSDEQEPATNNDKLFILDVEGSDGVERGEDQDFERKAALFALAVSEVLMINLWEQQIGLYQGNNLGLLKTVFEVNLSLFGISHEKRKMLLLFVIRDHIGVTPIESLATSLTSELNKIWDQLNKPKGMDNVTLDEFFDLEFVGLGHKILQEDKFYQDVKLLGDSFKTDNLYFKSNYHNNNLPLDAWNLYANNCWEQIENNKDLDLPTQQILVARFKTNEILEEAIKDNLDNFNELVTNCKNDIDSLLTNLIDLKDKTLDQYDRGASHYIDTIYLENKNFLTNKINNIFHPVVKSTINTFIESLLNDLQAMVNNILLQKGNKTSFIDTINDLKTKIKSKYDDKLNDYQSNDLLNIDTDTNMNITYQDEFATKLDIFIKDLIDKQLKTIITQINKRTTSQIKNDITQLLNNPKKDLWDQIITKFNKIIDTNLNKYKKTELVNETDTIEKEQIEDEKVKSENDEPSSVIEKNQNQIYDFQMGLTQLENDKLVTQIRFKSWVTLNNVIHDSLKIDTIVNILREIFENSFRYDENDMPIFWKDDFEIDNLFKLAKERSMVALDILTNMQHANGDPIVIDIDLEKYQQEQEQKQNNNNFDKDFDIDEDELDSLFNFNNILNELERESVLKQFKRQINITVIDAKRSILRSNTHIPIWIYLVIIVLGWNEFMIILRNPMYVTLSIILLVTFYFVHKFDLWDPVLRVTYTAIGETRSTVKSKLRDYVLDENEKSVKAN